MRRWAWAVLLLVAAATGLERYRQRPLHRPAGVLVPEAPEQSPVTGPTWQQGDYRLTPLALYHLRARVLGTERYRLDPMAALVPVDVAVGWGPMSDSAFLADLDISQRGRFFWVEWRDPDRDPTLIMQHASNMHLIAGSAGVARQIKALRVGQVVELRGLLVAADRPDGWHARSSLVRTDTGDGACELMWVEWLKVFP